MKCEICGKEILRDSQCINYKYYHNNCIENFQEENEQLKIQISAIEEVCNRLESNWNKLKEFIVESNKTLCWTNNYDSILGKMKELQGSDSNVKD